MNPFRTPLAKASGYWRYLAILAASVLLAASLIGCGGGETDDASEKVLAREAKMHSLEESLEAIQDENTALNGELATLKEESTEQKAAIGVLRQAQADLLTDAEAAREHVAEVAGLGEVQAEQILTLLGEQARSKQRLDGLDARVGQLEEAVSQRAGTGERQARSEEQWLEDLDARVWELGEAASQQAGTEERQARSEEQLDDLDTRVEELEEAVAKAGWSLPSKDDWSRQKDGPSFAEGETVLERTVSLVGPYGGEIYNIDFRELEQRSILLMPLEFKDDEVPLIVSLHGFGGNSADHSLYIPLHEHVISRGFGLLLANGTRNADGQRLWNPNDQSNTSSKSSVDDVAYLTDLVARAKEVKDFGPVYFFGHSNGGFMSHYIACKGLPGLRAVASLAGTSYVEDSSCDGAPPVSVLHIHGTADEVVLFEGDETEPDPKGDGERAFYAGARDMVARGAQRVGCEWPEDPQPYGTFDFDRSIPGAETQAYRLDGCVEGITVELWQGDGSSHSPGYSDAFVDALVDWLLSQK